MVNISKAGVQIHLFEQWEQDIWGWIAHLLDKVSFTPDGVQENEATSQIYDAIESAHRDLFPLYDATHTYIKGAVVIATDDNDYKSLIAANLNNEPSASPSEWLQVGSLATTTMAGLVEIATPAENIAGSSDVVTPTVKGIREGFNAAGTAPVFACRAWVNFDGTGGSITPNASGNVTSVTDNAVGDYSVNFTTAIEDINYSVLLTGTLNAGATTGNPGADAAIYDPANNLTTSVRIRSYDTAGAGFRDCESFSVAIFR